MHSYNSLTAKYPKRVYTETRIYQVFTHDLTCDHVFYEV